MSDEHQFWATIDDDDPRAADWQAVFGTLTVPIESPKPHWGNLPGYDQPERVFMLAWWLLPFEQIARLTRHISQTFSLPEPEITAQLARHGVPILAHNVTVAIRRPALTPSVTCPHCGALLIPEPPVTRRVHCDACGGWVG